MNARPIIALGAMALMGLTVLTSQTAWADQHPQATPPPPTAPADGDQDERQDPRYDASITVPAGADTENEADEAASLAGLATITADQARDSALAKFPGATVVKVELENENGALVYGVELTDASGKGQDVKVDAGNGSVLHVDSDGPDDDAEGGESDDEADDEADD